MRPFTQQATATLRYFPTKTVIHLPQIRFESIPYKVIQRGAYISLILDSKPDTEYERTEWEYPDLGYVISPLGIINRVKNVLQ
jgi:hypothetical protein